MRTAGRPCEKMVPFAAQLLAQSLRMAEFELSHARQGEALHAIRMVVRELLPDPSDAVNVHHLDRQRHLLRNTDGDSEHLAAQRDLAVLIDSAMYQEEVCRHVAAVFYSATLLAAKHEWLPRHQLVEFIGEWLGVLDHPVGAVAGTSRFLDTAAEDVSRTRTIVTHEVEFRMPEPQEQLRREGHATWIGGLNVTPLHLAVRIALAQTRRGIFRLEVIPYSTAAALMGRDDSIGRALEELQDYAGFFQELGVEDWQEDAATLRIVYSGHAAEMKRRERQALLDAPLSEAGLLAMVEAVTSGLADDPILLPGFARSYDTLTEGSGEPFSAQMSVPRRWFTTSAGNVRGEAGAVSNWFCGQLAGYCLHLLSETAGKTVVAAERDGRVVAELVLQELAQLRLLPGRVFIPVSLRRGMKQHPEHVIHDQQSLPEDDSLTESLACADLSVLPGYRGDRAWAVVGDAIATYSVGDVSLSIVDERDSEKTDDPMVVVEVAVPLVVDFAVDPQHILVIDLPPREEDARA